MRRILLAIAMAVLLFGSTSQAQTATHAKAWKQYSYPSDQFSISSPQPPKLTAVKDYDQYLVYWNQQTDVVINLTVRLQPSDCSAWAEHAKSLVGNASAIVMVAGQPALETRAARNGLQEGYRLVQCLNERLYIFESGWTRGKPKPAIIAEVLKSFQVIERKPE